MTSSAAQKKLADRCHIWEAKPVLNEVYRDLFARIGDEVKIGTVLEVGSGSGLSRAFRPDFITSDVVAMPWIDLALNCEALPFADGSLDNIVMIDVLHHLESPMILFEEASRVLAVGGRMVIIEPAMTLISRPFYAFLHEEPVDMDIDPFVPVKHTMDRDPFDANQAIPTLIFKRHSKRFTDRFPKLCVKTVSYFSLWCYPLSGGFKNWSLLPCFLAPPMLRLERCLEPILGRVFGFRMMVVVERLS